MQQRKVSSESAGPRPSLPPTNNGTSSESAGPFPPRPPRINGTSVGLFSRPHFFSSGHAMNCPLQRAPRVSPARSVSPTPPQSSAIRENADVPGQKPTSSSQQKEVSSESAGPPPATPPPCIPRPPDPKLPRVSPSLPRVPPRPPCTGELGVDNRSAVSSAIESHCATMDHTILAAMRLWTLWRR